VTTGQPPFGGDIAGDDSAHWSLTLYVSGAGPRSSAAVGIVRDLCDTELAGRFDLTVRDAADHPSDVVRDHIVALPTLIKESPEPRRYVVGDFTDLARLREALDLSAPPTPKPTEGDT
jgi:circadian clock protein KaiB